MSGFELRMLKVGTHTAKPLPNIYNVASLLLALSLSLPANNLANPHYSNPLLILLFEVLPEHLITTDYLLGDNL